MQGEAETLEVVIGQFQTDRHGVLERSARNKRQVLAHNPHGSDEVGGSGGPANLPAGEGKHLAARADGDGALVHAGQRRHGYMRVAVEPHVLIGLIGNHQQVVLDREPCNFGSFVGCEDSARRIVG